MESSLSEWLNKLDQLENPKLSEDKIMVCLNNGKISDDEKDEIVKRIQGSLSLATCHLIYAVVRHLFDEHPAKIYCWKKDEIDFAQIKKKLEDDDKAEGERLYLNQCLRGYFYYRGVASEKDPKKAFKFYQEAATKKDKGQGYARAQTELGYCYREGIGVDQSDQKAAQYYQKAADQGYARAQAKLGYCYKQGIGVDQSDEKTVEYYQKAADQGYARAQAKLGYCYRKGIGVDQSDQKAVEYYQKAADQGYARAQADLGYYYLKGIGVDQSDQKAVEYYQKAADQGYARAQAELGYCYEKGIVIAQDFVKAHYWYSRAAAQGHAWATKLLEALYWDRDKACLELFLLSVDLLATVKQLGGTHKLSRFLLDQLHEIPLTEKKAIETRRSIGLYVHLKSYLSCPKRWYNFFKKCYHRDRCCSLLKEDSDLFYEHFMENKADYLNRTDFNEELMSSVLQAAQEVSPDQLYPQLCVQMGLYWESRRDIKQAESYYKQVKFSDKLDQTSQKALGLWYFSIWSKWRAIKIEGKDPSVISKKKDSSVTGYENLTRKKATVFLLSSVLSKQPEGQAVDQESKQEGSVIQALDSEGEFLVEKLLKSNIVQPLSVLLGLEEIFISPNSYVIYLLLTIEYIKSAPGNTLEDKVTSYFNFPDEFETPSEETLETIFSEKALKTILSGKLVTPSDSKEFETPSDETLETILSGKLVTPSGASLSGGIPETILSGKLVTPLKKTPERSNLFVWLLSCLNFCFTSLFSDGDKSKEEIPIPSEGSGKKSDDIDETTQKEVPRVQINAGEPAQQNTITSALG